MCPRQISSSMTSVQDVKQPFVVIDKAQLTYETEIVSTSSTHSRQCVGCNYHANFYPLEST